MNRLFVSLPRQLNRPRGMVWDVITSVLALWLEKLGAQVQVKKKKKKKESSPLPPARGSSLPYTKGHQNLYCE